MTQDSPLQYTLHLHPPSSIPPDHHVVAPAPTTSWSSYLASWIPQPETIDTPSTGPEHTLQESHTNGIQSRLDYDNDDPLSCVPLVSNMLNSTSSSTSTSLPTEAASSKLVRTGFKNPWDSWRKPSLAQIWNGLEWCQDDDPCISLAIEDAEKIDPEIPIESSKTTDAFFSWSLSSSNESESDKTFTTAAYKLLHLVSPDFTFQSTDCVKVTWLGHAGILLQLAPLVGQDLDRPLRIIFDPIFSSRCSPTQYAGPIRSYPPPCHISSLPEIDLVIISHNHYDHLDLDTILSLWKLNHSRLRFLVPLGNKLFFVSSPFDIPDDRVIELDWWESVDFHLHSSSSENIPFKITCTPAQHGSGRYGFDTNSSLWASWFLSCPFQSSSSSNYKVFFAGDTGYQFHDSNFPPSPSSPFSTQDINNDNDLIDKSHPICPIFNQIQTKLGSANLVFLPISIGATFSFIKSYFSLLPTIKSGLTSVNHLSAWDSIQVFKTLTKNQAIMIPIHWGTFTCTSVEVLKQYGDLKLACFRNRVQLVRPHSRSKSDDDDDDDDRSVVVLHHGESVVI